MNIDDILRTSVDDLARSVTPPPPDRRGVRARARSTQRRQWVAAAAGTAAVVVGGVAIANGLPDQTSTPPTNDPDPRPTTVVPANGSAIWGEAKSVHFGSRQVPAPDGVFGFGLVEGGAVYSTDSRDAKVFYQPADGSDPRQIGDNAQVSPGGDPASGLAAWFEANGKEGSLVVYDTKIGEEVARTSVPPALRPQDNIIFPGFGPVISLSPSGVYYHGPGEEIWVYRWKDRAIPESTGQTKDELFDVAGGVTAQAGSAEGTVEFVTSGGTTAVSDLPPGGYLNSDGSLFASVDMNEGGLSGIAIVDTSTGETTSLDVFGSEGRPGLLFGVGWSTDDTLMVKNDAVSEESGDTNSITQVIACTATTGGCDVVATVKKQSFLVTVPLS